MADRTSSSITIDAGKPEVMAVIADFAAYPEWADGIKSAEVVEPADETDGGGRARRVRMTLEAGPIRDAYVLAYTWDGDEGVGWELAEGGSVLTALTGSYRLAGHKDGVEVTYELAVDVRIPMIGMMRRKAEKMIIDSALKGLKRRVEERAADAGHGAEAGSGADAGHGAEEGRGADEA